MMKEKSKRLIILLHEIYGVNQHMNFVQKTLEGAGYDVICPNLLNRQSYGYLDEKEAYLNYINTVGFETPLKTVKRLVEDNRNIYRSIYILGFSVGATTAWLCSQLDIQGVICFYGSRIRDHVQVEPGCPALLFFAKRESSFNPEELANMIRKKPNVAVYIFDGKHGFADPFSINYDEALFKQTKKLMRQFLLQGSFATCVE